MRKNNASGVPIEYETPGQIIKDQIKKISNPNLFRKKIVGLALGGGSAKGLTHIGVLKALERHGIKIDMIAGSSMGALIGALYCVHQNAKIVEKIAKGFDFKKYIDVKIPKHGLIQGKKLEGMFADKLEHSKFKDAQIPIFITATDIMDNREIVFNSGDLATAVRASISMPGIFVPAQVGKMLLIDGVMKNPLPVDILRENGCDIVIAVNLDGNMEKPRLYAKAEKTKNPERIPGILDIIVKSQEIMELEAARFHRSVSGADVLLEPHVSSSDFFKFNKTTSLIRKGELAVESQIKKIKKVTKRSLV